MIVIYGAGIVGANAFSNLYPEQNCIIIDIQPLPEYFPKRELIHIINNLDQIELKQTMNGEYFHYFIQGSIETLYSIFCSKIPDILFATAPIHVMAELLLFTINKLIPSIIIDQIAIANSRFKDQNPPNNLNLQTVPPNKIYFSYAKWDERCPDDCMGPPFYCPNFQREKDETVTEFITRACKEQIIGPNMPHLFQFPSKQIIGGLGGIFKDVLLNGWNRWLEIISSPPIERHIIIATSCNCHGVAEEIKIRFE